MGENNHSGSIRALNSEPVSLLELAGYQEEAQALNACIDSGGEACDNLLSQEVLWAAWQNYQNLPQEDSSNPSPFVFAGAAPLLKPSLYGWIPEVIEGGKGLPKPTPTPSRFPVGGLAAAALLVYTAHEISYLSDYFDFQQDLLNQGAVILPDPRSICMQMCHYGVPQSPENLPLEYEETFPSELPFIFNEPDKFDNQILSYLQTHTQSEDESIIEFPDYSEITEMPSIEQTPFEEEPLSYPDFTVTMPDGSEYPLWSESDGDYPEVFDFLYQTDFQVVGVPDLEAWEKWLEMEKHRQIIREIEGEGRRLGQPDSLTQWQILEYLEKIGLSYEEVFSSYSPVGAAGTQNSSTSDDGHAVVEEGAGELNEDTLAEEIAEAAEGIQTANDADEELHFSPLGQVDSKPSNPSWKRRLAKKALSEVQRAVLERVNRLTYPTDVVEVDGSRLMEEWHGIDLLLGETWVDLGSGNGISLGNIASDQSDAIVIGVDYMDLIPSALMTEVYNGAENLQNLPSNVRYIALTYNQHEEIGPLEFVSLREGSHEMHHSVQGHEKLTEILGENSADVVSLIFPWTEGTKPGIIGRLLGQKASDPLKDQLTTVIQLLNHDGTGILVTENPEAKERAIEFLEFQPEVKQVYHSRRPLNQDQLREIGIEPFSTITINPSGESEEVTFDDGYLIIFKVR